MRKFFLVSGTAVLSLILLGNVLVHKSDAAPTCAEGLSQELRTRCTRLTVPKHKPKTEKRSHGSQMRPGTRCSRYGWNKTGILPNTPPTVALKTSVDKITLACKSGETQSVCTTDAKVQLRSVASDADGDTLLYTYSVTGGKVTGDGPEVVWDLSGLEVGSYMISVEVDDGCGCINLADATVSVVTCPDCKPQ